MRLGRGWFLLLCALGAVFAWSSLNPPVVTAQPEQVIRIKAKKFAYLPNEITLKKGVPVVLELTSLDLVHGFNCPAFKIRGEIHPRKITKIRFTPDKVGTFEFHCDIFCGSGCETMNGKFKVTE
jgi:cytochrome c oxidase subunit II